MTSVCPDSRVRAGQEHVCAACNVGRPNQPGIFSTSSLAGRVDEQAISKMQSIRRGEFSPHDPSQCQFSLLHARRNQRPISSCSVPNATAQHLVSRYCIQRQTTAFKPRQDQRKDETRREECRRLYIQLVVLYSPAMQSKAALIGAYSALTRCVSEEFLSLGFDESGSTDAKVEDFCVNSDAHGLDYWRLCIGHFYTKFVCIDFCGSIKMVN